LHVCVCESSDFLTLFFLTPYEHNAPEKGNEEVGKKSLLS